VCDLVDMVGLKGGLVCHGGFFGAEFLVLGSRRVAAKAKFKAIF